MMCYDTSVTIYSGFTAQRKAVFFSTNNTSMMPMVYQQQQQEDQKKTESFVSRCWKKDWKKIG